MDKRLIGELFTLKLIPENVERGAAIALELTPLLLILLEKQHIPSYDAESIALLLNRCGYFLSDAFEQRPEHEFIRLAIAAFEGCQQYWTHETAPLEWAGSGMNLANALTRLGQRMPGQAGVEILRRAVRAHERSLAVFSREATPLDWASSKSSLAIAHLNLGERLSGEAGTEHLHHAVRGHEASLTVWTRETAPADWASAQMNLANALVKLSERLGGEDGVECLRRAVRANEASLTIRSLETRGYAMSHLNLANAHLKLSERLGSEKGLESLHRAVQAYNTCLTVFTHETMPVQWAFSQMNLGGALLRLGEWLKGEDGTESLRRALEAYTTCLVVFTRETMPLQWSIAQTNLAVAEVRLGERLGGEEKVRSLRRAVRAHEASLTVLTSEATPLDWANAQVSLAGTLWRLGEVLHGNEGIESFHRAVRGYEASLTVLTRETTPLDWARSRNNLAVVHSRLGDRIGGEDGLESLRLAVRGHEASLTAFTRETAPRQWLDSQTLLANAYLCLAKGLDGNERLENLRLAQSAFLELTKHSSDIYNEMAHITALRVSITPALHLGEWESVVEAGEALAALAPMALLATLTHRDYEEVYGSFLGAADNTAYGLAKQGRMERAVLAAEHGRARALRDHLQQKLAGLSQAQEADLKGLREKLEQSRDAYSALDHSAAADLRDGAFSQLRQAREAFEGMVRSAGLLPKPLPADFWCQAAPKEGFVVQITVTLVGSLAMVIPEAAEKLDERHAVFLSDFDHAKLIELLSGDHGWLKGYQAFREDLARTSNQGGAVSLEAWNRRIEETLIALSALMNPISEKLRELGGEPGAPVVLIAPGLLANLPLHAAGKRESKQWCCFLDDWTPSYAPSIAALAHLQTLSPSGNHLLAITNPEQDFGGTHNPAVNYFAAETQTELVGPQATRAMTLAGLAQADYACFLCHGVWEPQAIDQSGLHLADGHLRVAELRGASLAHAPIIALGACETAQGSLGTMADEMNGLPLALIQAGARGVAATFWPVFGHAADAILNEFFKAHRMEHLSPAAAMRHAVLAMRDGSPTAAPLAKAAFRSSFRVFSGIPGTQNEGATRDDLLRDFSNPMHWAVYGYYGQ